MRLKFIRRYVPAALRDLRLFLTGKADPELPPFRLRRVGAGDFRAMGAWVRDLLVENGLRPADRVLDIGCGVGRVAIALNGYLDATASYEGFDADRSIIRWCRKNITARDPRFRFTHARVRAPGYSLFGRPAERFRFPYADGAFDFAFATSVFTHMQPAETANYLAEAGRVLAPGGRLLATFFLAYGNEQAPGRGALLAAAELPRVLPAEAWSWEVRPGNWRETGVFSIKGQDVVVAVRR
jgi:SAM-dependent methyltransferase